MEILAISGTPRKRGNSRILLEAFLKEAPSDAVVSLFDAYSMKVHPCRACDSCKGGSCVISDEMQLLYPSLDRADTVIVSHPIYFYGPPAPIKAIYDRCQPYWHKREVKDKRAVLIVTSASASERGFEVSASIFRAWANTIGAKDFLLLKFGGLEAEEEVLNRPEMLSEVTEHGQRFFGSQT